MIFDILIDTMGRKWGVTYHDVNDFNFKKGAKIVGLMVLIFHKNSQLILISFSIIKSSDIQDDLYLFKNKILFIIERLLINFLIL